MSTKETVLMLALRRITWAVVLLPAMGARLDPHVPDELLSPTAAS